MNYLNAMAERVHAANIKWWQDPKTGKPIERNRKGLIALVITEFAEALEGERKNLMDDKLPHRKMAEVEMADAVIRLLDFAGGFKIKKSELPAKRITVANEKSEAIFDMIFLATFIGSGSDIHVWRTIEYIELYCAVHGYDLAGAIEEKLHYNSTRFDHTHEARLAEGGKKW